MASCRFLLALILAVMMGCASRYDTVLGVKGRTNYWEPSATAVSGNGTIDITLSSDGFAPANITSASVAVLACDKSPGGMVGDALSQQDPSCLDIGCHLSGMNQSGRTVFLGLTCRGTPLSGRVYVADINLTAEETAGSAADLIFPFCQGNLTRTCDAEFALVGIRN